MQKGKQGKLIDMVGVKFNGCEVIRRAKNKEGVSSAVWECRCFCGKTFDAKGTAIRNGKRSSCGCGRSVSLSKRNYKHGGTKTRLFTTWINMRNRCYNEKNDAYERYGGRGIEVCEEWRNDFLSFREWAEENGYNDTLTIDRIDNDSGYYPENCRWVGYDVQNQNKRNAVRVPFRGELMSRKEVSEITGLTYDEVRWREEKGTLRSY